MTPDQFLSIMDNPNLISGIYNYCDRWCERCPKTDRCSVFLSTPKMDPKDFPDEDSFFKEVFQNLHDSFQLSMDLLQKSADEKGIDLIQNEVDTVPLSGRAEKEQIANANVRKAPISILSMDYLELSRTWLKNSSATLKDIEERLQRTALMDLPNRNPEKEAADIRDVLEVISYYNGQIYIKLIRAQEGRQEDDAWFEENEFPKDSDGSAKVALIGIDRSTNAWGELLHHLPQQEDTILPILSRLEKLRGQTETLFPNARAFIRPGFDD